MTRPPNLSIIDLYFMQYASSKQILIVGKFSATLKLNSKMIKEKVLVVESANFNLLSSRASEQLAIIVFINMIYANSEYLELFKSIGKLKN